MFKPQETPRVYAVPLGVDFTKALFTNLQGYNPLIIAQTELYLNTQRMRHTLTQHYLSNAVQFLPKLRLLTELPYLRDSAQINDLERQLELADLVRPLLEITPDLAPKTAAYDLAVSLSRLMDEMAIEGVDPSAIEELSIPDESGHWARSLEFIRIVQQYFKSDARVSPGLRQRHATDDQIARWGNAPPAHPVIIAGSTGSRQTTHDLMIAAAKLPQGAIVLPGFDWSAPWSELTRGRHYEDHPQYRYAKLLSDLGISADEVMRWDDISEAPLKRSAFTSLALRPAPVTHHWMTEGPNLGDLSDAFSGVTWLNAPDEKTEAKTIAARLRVAAETGETAAVISPDRNLTRRISATLSQWGIIPDDSAGVPLSQTPPGRFILHIIDAISGTLDMPKLLALLKHPLSHSGPGRGSHLKHTRDLELYLRRYGPAFPTQADLLHWAEKDGDRLPWIVWLNNTLTTCPTDIPQNLNSWAAALERIASSLSAGTTGEGGTVWDEESGRMSKAALDTISESSDVTGDYEFGDFANLLRRLLQDGQVTQQRTPHPNIMIWGTLEARVQSADVVILAGLNEGVWPASPTPDPWMNRRMRSKVGLLNPDRNIGLAAHDFQIGFSNAQVWVTRSMRSSDAETVPSRWLNRMSNLLNGLSADETHPLMDQMLARGAAWQAAAQAHDAPEHAERALRPSPCPPLENRPTELPVTGITTLIRDPYAIYAKYILGLRPLNPLLAQPDNLLRGNIVHKVLEETVKLGPFGDAVKGVQVLMDVALQVLEGEVPWPADRRKWLALIAQNADWFMAHEMQREAELLSSHLEIEGKSYIPPIDFTLTAKADRVDVFPDGAQVYDYKTGKPPTKEAQRNFDKQLLLEVEMLRRGAFPTILTRDVKGGTYIAMGATPNEMPVADDDDQDTWTDLIKLISAYQDHDQSYTARRAPQYMQYDSDYDHLARFGEWDETEDAQKVIIP